MTKRKLTGKQDLFTEYYAEELNGTKAARLAGYKGNDNALAVMGNKLLRNTKVRDKIEELLDAKKLSPGEVLARISDQAKGSMEYFLEVGKLEGINTINLEQARRADKLHLLKSVKVTKSAQGNSSVSIELYSSQSALDKLAKVHGLYQERVDLTTGGQSFDLEAWGKTRAKRKADVEAMDDENES